MQSPALSNVGRKYYLDRRLFVKARVSTIFSNISLQLGVKFVLEKNMGILAGKNNKTAFQRIDYLLFDFQQRSEKL